MAQLGKFLPSRHEDLTLTLKHKNIEHDSIRLKLHLAGRAEARNWWICGGHCLSVKPK